MTKPPKPRHTVFFASIDNGLAVFARQVVDIDAGLVKGVAVNFARLEVKMPPGVTLDRPRFFWVVTEVPEDLRRLLTEEDWVAQGHSGYRVGLPSDSKLLQLFRAAEVAARRELFPERYPTELAAE